MATGAARAVTMIRSSFIVRRLLLAIPTLFGVLVVAFLLLYVAPGDPVQAMIGERADAETIARLRAQLHLDDPLYSRFGHYVGDPLTYRSKDATEKVRTTRDPIDNFEKRVVKEGTLATSELRAADDQVAKAIAAAVRFAEASASPDPSELLTDVYVDYPD